MTDQTVKLAIEGGDFSYPLLPGSVGPDVIDIRKLYAQTGKFTYDPGFTSTASCQSAITYIDGDEGILLHRGYPIDQLAEKSSFMEVAYLLLHGDLPQQAELDGGVDPAQRGELDRVALAVGHPHLHLLKRFEVVADEDLERPGPGQPERRPALPAEELERHRAFIARIANPIWDRYALAA